MFLLDDILLAPLKTVIWLGEQIHDSAEKEFSDEDKAKQWLDFHERNDGGSRSNRLYTCGAGLNTFHVDPYGNLQPCLMTRKYGQSLTQVGFKSVWHENMPHIREICAPEGFPCNRCRQNQLCGYCPAAFELEKGFETVPSEYYCALGRLRDERINKFRSRV